MKNRKLEIAIKMLIALLIFALFRSTQEKQQYLISFIALGASVIASIITYKKTFPLFMAAMISYFICSYMKLFGVNSLFYMEYDWYFAFGSVMFFASLFWYGIEELNLFFTNEKTN